MGYEDPFEGLYGGDDMSGGSAGPNPFQNFGLTEADRQAAKKLAFMRAGMGVLAANKPGPYPQNTLSLLGQGGLQGMDAYQGDLRARMGEKSFASGMALNNAKQQALQQRGAAADAQRAATLQAQQAFAATLTPEQRVAFEADPPKFMEAYNKQRLAGPRAYGPGTQLFREGQDDPFYTVPFRPADPKPAAAPMTRKIRIGEDEVAQEYVDGSWREVGRGPMFSRGTSTAAAAKPPKPPTGYEWTDDTHSELRTIRGGPKDTSGKDDAKAKGAIQKADIVIGKVDEALNQTGVLSTGLTGKVLGMVPGTKAYDLDKTIDTIKAQIGFSELQAMREASPTGGALGQVAIQELVMLQSTIASLEHGQSEAQVRRALQQVKKHFENWKGAVTQSQQGQAPAAAPAAPASPQAPQGGGVVDFSALPKRR
jgi:hypothetical protein